MEKELSREDLILEIEELRKTNELYLTILDSIKESVYAIDEDNKIILYNKRVEEVEGYQRSDMLGRNEREIYCYDNTPYFTFITDNIKKNLKPIIQKPYLYHMKNGRKLHIITDCFPFIYQGEYHGMYTIGQTVTQARDVMEAIIDMQENFHNIIDSEKSSASNNFLENMIGKSKIMMDTIDLARRIAIRGSVVMIIGETGTGKELFARGIHHASPYQKGPFVPINCGAVPDNLLESILFGTVKGAFTGAVEIPGIFEQAENGTIFLDEIDSMPLMLQSKLLRVIQEKTIRRLGSQKEISINCRIISATNVTPEKMEEAFRSDLLFRISVINLHLPPLRNRPEDIPLLAKHFIQRFNEKFYTNITAIDEDLQRILYLYHWPGNVRELENVIECAMNFVDVNDTVLHFNHIPDYYKEKLSQTTDTNTGTNKYLENTGETLRSALIHFEKNYLLNALERNHWNITHAANQLGMKRQNLHAKIRQYGFVRPEV